jgi:hypothetical protein
MANNPTTMLALPFYVSGARTLYITNDLTSSATAVTIPQGYYANFLVNSSSSDGTQANPYDVISEFNRACGQYFDFSLNEDGKTKITYRGIVGGTLSFVSSTLAKNILGFNTTSISFSSTSVATSSYQPYGTVFTFGATNDTSWNRQFSSTGFSGLPDGRVYGFKDDYVKFTRKTDLRFHPYSQIEKELLSSNTATPVHQISKSLWGQPPSLLDSTYEQPYTLDHFLYESPGIPVREARSTLQQHLANTDNKFDIVYIDPETIAQENQYQPSIANYSKILDMKDLKVSLYQSALRFNKTNSTNLTGSFAPSDLSGLTAWYRGDVVVYDGSNKVSQWTDQSGNGYHLLQSNASYKPTYVSSIAGKNSKPGVQAVSAGEYLQCASFPMSVAKTVVIVVGSFTAGSYITALTNASTEYFYVYHPGTATFFNKDEFFGTHYITNTGGNFFVANTDHMFIYDLSAPTLYRDNVSVAGSIGGAALSAGTQSGDFSLFSAKNGSFGSRLQILEVIVYSKALNSTERTQLDSYLTARYS